VTTQASSSLLGSPEGEIELISNDAMHRVSEIKLIRTNTTLNLSQKAEKVWHSAVEIGWKGLCLWARLFLKKLKHTQKIVIIDGKKQISYQHPWIVAGLQLACGEKRERDKEILQRSQSNDPEFSGGAQC
jgi:hypothetical protein